MASEFVARGEQAGRIDTLGLDSEGAPTIIEYKSRENANVINQGLYYMNWLVEHRGDFELAVQRQLGQRIEVNWSHPRLIILVQTYNKYDNYAVKRMGTGIELWRYVLYGEELLYLELVFGQQRTATIAPVAPSTIAESEPVETYTLEYHLAKGSAQLQVLFEALRDGILALASEEGEIIETPNKLYVSYRHGRNICEVEVQARALKVHIDIPFDTVRDPKSFARDVSSVGHWGTGDIEVKVNSPEDVEYALMLIEQAYQLTV